MKPNMGRKLLITFIALLNPLALSCLINVFPPIVLVILVTVFCCLSAYMAYVTDPNPEVKT